MAIILIDDWFTNLVFEKLPAHQGVEITPLQANNILEELKATGFATFLRPAAEQWILFGDWSYKKPKTLTVNDFFPTEVQLKIRDNFISMSEHLASVKSNVSKLKESYNKQMEAQVDEIFKREFVSRKIYNSEIHSEYLKLLEEKNTLAGRIDALTLENASLKRRIEKLGGNN